MYFIETDDFYEDIAPDVKKSLTHQITPKNIHQEFKQELTKKSLENLKMK